jgi:hypothetical protein
MKESEELFNFTLLEVSFIEQKSEQKREWKATVQGKWILK